MHNSYFDIPRGRRPVTLLIVAFLYMEEWANTKQL